jgi:hypothetical protein
MEDTVYVTCRLGNNLSRILVLKDENPCRWLGGSDFWTDRRELLNQRHGFTSRKAGILDYMLVKPQKLQMQLSFEGRTNTEPTYAKIRSSHH